MAVKDIKSEQNELLQLVSFMLGNEEFGIDILQVQEIIKMIEITEIPNSPDFVEGVINLRGRVIPIIDLRVKLGFETQKVTNSTRIVVVEMNSNTVGFIVDAVNEVLRITTDIIEEPPALVAGINSEFITAVGKLEGRLLILLDLNKLLSLKEKMELVETL